MHYSQLPADIVEHKDGPDAPLELRAQGFLTAEITGACIQRLHDRAKSPTSGAGLDDAVLIDLRDAVGYESQVPGMVAAWFGAAHLLGVRRIAMVANSSVLRTALATLSGGPTPVRCFPTHTAALRWLASERAEPTHELPAQSSGLSTPMHLDA